MFSRIAKAAAKEMYDYLKDVVLGTLVVTVLFGLMRLGGHLLHSQGAVIMASIMWCGFEIVIIFDPLWEDFKFQCKRIPMWVVRQSISAVKRQIDLRAGKLSQEHFEMLHLKIEYSRSLWQSWNIDDREYLARCPRRQRRTLREIMQKMRFQRAHLLGINYDP